MLKGTFAGNEDGLPGGTNASEKKRFSVIESAPSPNDDDAEEEDAEEEEEDGAGASFLLARNRFADSTASA